MKTNEPHNIKVNMYICKNVTYKMEITIEKKFNAKIISKGTWVGSPLHQQK